MGGDALTHTNSEGSLGERCSKAGGWRRSGTVAAIHTAALSDGPRGETSKDMV